MKNYYFFLLLTFFLDDLPWAHSLTFAGASPAHFEPVYKQCIFNAPLRPYYPGLKFHKQVRVSPELRAGRGLGMLCFSFDLKFIRE